MFNCRQPLHRSRVRQSKCPNIAVRPGLPRRPLNRVVAVIPLILIRQKLAVRRIAPAHILNHNRISSNRQLLKRAPLLWRILFPVGSPVHQGRESPFRTGKPYIGAQNYAIPHRHGHILQHDPRLRGLVLFLRKPEKPSSAENHQPQSNQSDHSMVSHRATHSIPTHLYSLVDPSPRLRNNDCTMTSKLSGKKLAVLGTGKLGGILLRAYLKQNLFTPNNVTATVRHEEKAAALAKDLGVTASTDNRKAVRGADIVLLGVKPQVVGDVLKEIKPELDKDTLVISVAASVPTAYIEQRLGEKIPVIRAMPNTCSIVGTGMTGICKGARASAEHLEIAKALFDAVGRTVVVDEKNMDAVTGLSASGPAFAYIILESLAEAGVKVGLPRDVATLLAAQTMKGSASVVLETGDHPALLKDSVTTPAGCTIDGIMELEEGKLRVTLIKAVVKATQRAGELLFEK